MFNAIEMIKKLPEGATLEFRSSFLEAGGVFIRAHWYDIAPTWHFEMIFSNREIEDGSIDYAAYFCDLASHRYQVEMNRRDGA